MFVEYMVSWYVLSATSWASAATRSSRPPTPGGQRSFASSLTNKGSTPNEEEEEEEEEEGIDNDEDEGAPSGAAPSVAVAAAAGVATSFGVLGPSLASAFKRPFSAALSPAPFAAASPASSSDDDSPVAHLV